MSSARGSGPPRRVCLLSITAIADDVRIRRQGDALHDLGIEVHGVGIEGAESPPPAWEIHEMKSRPTRVRQVGTGLRAMSALAGTDVATRAYWTSSVHRRVREAAMALTPDLVIANDWRTLPVAAAVSDETGARVHYDSHEFAVEERLDSLLWRTVIRPYVAAIEGAFIGRATSVTTVAEGIATAMAERYRLDPVPVVVRNVPVYVAAAFRRTTLPIKVLFHGALMGDRGLDRLIASVQEWTPDRRLIIRGSGDPGFVRQLRQLAYSSGVKDRVTFEPAVPRADVISAASRCDIGVHVPLPGSTQMEHSLPNKFFEYVMAGLAVCVTDLPAMALIVRGRDLGVVAEGTTPAEIATAINGLTPEAIDRHKKNALLAAKELSWTHELGRLLSALAIPERG